MKLIRSYDPARKKIPVNEQPSADTTAGLSRVREITARKLYSGVAHPRANGRARAYLSHKYIAVPRPLDH